MSGSETAIRAFVGLGRTLGARGEPPRQRATLLRDVMRYYATNQFFYDRFWTDTTTRSMNYGFWLADTWRLRDAFVNQNRAIAEALAVEAGDLVLEAGCGRGGTSVWLVRERGSRGVGITLCRRQARRASELAEREEVGARVVFSVTDFTQTGFRDESFSKIFASESACYAWDKAEFVREAYRLLRPGGRLLVIDGFRPDRSLAAVERRLLASWAKGWAVPDLAGIAEFGDDLTAAGFEDVTFTDLTDLILPSARRILWRGLLAYPLALLARALGRLTAAQRAHVSSSLTQYVVWSRGVGSYGMFSARRPARRGRECGAHAG